MNAISMGFFCMEITTTDQYFLAENPYTIGLYAHNSGIEQ